MGVHATGAVDHFGGARQHLLGVAAVQRAGAAVGADIDDGGTLADHGGLAGDDLAGHAGAEHEHVVAGVAHGDLHGWGRRAELGSGAAGELGDVGVEGLGGEPEGLGVGEVGVEGVDEVAVVELVLDRDDGFL